MPATVAALRAVLAQHFGEQRARTCLLRQREAGELAEGNAGRYGSAPVTIHQAAFALLMMALDNAGDALEAVTKAQRVADFRLRRIEDTHRSDPRPRIRHLDGVAAVTLQHYIAAEISAVAGAYPDHQPSGWIIDAYEAAQAQPEKRLVFTATEQPYERPVVWRQCVIGARAIAEVAELFDVEPPHFTESERRQARAALAI